MLSNNEITPGQLYVWSGIPKGILEYSPKGKTPDKLRIENPELRKGDLFVVLEVDSFNMCSILKILTTKGELGYIYSWNPESVNVIVVDSLDDIP